MRDLTNTELQYVYGAGRKSCRTGGHKTGSHKTRSHKTRSHKTKSHKSGSHKGSRCR
jgi:hypothetical protein